MFKHAIQDPRFGNALPNRLRSNGVNLWDLAVLKQTKISEQRIIEFRWELFNAWNHPVFGGAVASPENPNFGRTFGTQKDPRIMQVGIKYLF